MLLPADFPVSCWYSHERVSESRWRSYEEIYELQQQVFEPFNTVTSGSWKLLYDGDSCFRFEAVLKNKF